MNRIIGLSRADTGGNKGRVAVVQRSPEQEYSPSFPGDIQALLNNEAFPSLKKFLLFWTMMDTIKVHGYTRAAMGAIGRATIGAWWKITKHEEWGEQATGTQRQQLLNFYSGSEREWDNIKDYQTLAYKLTIGAMYLRYFGQVGFFIHRNGLGKPIGFDHLPGIIVPNIDELGYFKDPSFVQYPTKDPRMRTEFSDPREILYIINPDWEGSPLGGSDIEALTEYTLPLDIYLQTAAREYLKNSNRPELVYMLPQDISDEAFDTFVSLLNNRYGGAANRGRNPIAVQGELDIKRLDDLPADLPYQLARDDTREETLAVSGTSGSILGLSKSLSSANIRESRRQFHETTMEPLFRLIESGIYDQIHVREFSAPGWIFQFNNPDFLTAVERATVHMRYIQYGVLSPNEAREELGREGREEGDEYVTPIGMGDVEPQGSPPEGREDEPDGPSETGEPTNDDQDPPRGDQHDDETERALQELEAGDEVIPAIEPLEGEIREWRKFIISRMKRGMRLRPYKTKYVPEEIREIIQKRLENVVDVESVAIIFDEFFGALEEVQNG